jgi:hypothetical protein
MAVEPRRCRLCASGSRARRAAPRALMAAVLDADAVLDGIGLVS